MPATLQELGKCFAYIDDQGHLALYDMDAEETVWTDDLEAAPAVRPLWSPDGSILAYWCRAGDPDATYMAFVTPDDRLRTLVHLPNLDSWDFNLGASMSWSPSYRCLSLETASYPPSPVTVIDRSSMEVIHRFSCIAGSCWSPDETQFAYSDIEGKYFGGMGLFYSFLVIRDLATGEETVVARGDTDFTISPVQWTEDGEVIYAYHKGDVPTRWLDTAGMEYDSVDPVDAGLTYRYDKPESFPEGLGRVGWSSYDPDTGVWVVPIYMDNVEGKPMWLYLYKEGEEPVQLLKGSSPAWRP